MSIYNQAIYFNNNSVQPDPNYFGLVGSLQMLSECTINDRMMFEALIYDDFMEVKSVHENLELDIISEGKLTGQ